MARRSAPAGVLERAQREAVAKRVQDWLAAEHGIQLGGIGADALVEMVEAEVGPRAYNQGVRDAMATVARLHATAEEELSALQRIVPPG